MMLSSFLMIILAIILYNIFTEVNSAGLPNKFFQKTPLEKIPIQNAELLNNFEYKLDTITKIEKSVHNLQEISHKWTNFDNHIKFWNDGIRSLESKLNLLRKTHENQQQQLNKMELLINNNMDINDRNDQFLNELRQFLKLDHNIKNDITSKINNILDYLQLSLGNNEGNLNKISNINLPISGHHLGTCGNMNRKIEQDLSLISNQMAQQKDLKQLNSLEKRNSKTMENIYHVLSDQVKKVNDIIICLQQYNECSCGLSSELTTFTKSSDILLKRIEKLMRIISDKLNNIEVSKNSIDHPSAEKHNSDKEIEEEYDDGHDFGDLNKIANENSIGEDDNELEKEGTINYNNTSTTADEIFTYNNEDVEFLRPNLNGCHELLVEISDDDDDTTRIDGIYKFSTPDINDDERDFNERYCVFPTQNDMGLPWTVIQRRGPYIQQENFNRSWSEYRNGFGNLSRDFWFGNEFIHRLVYQDDYELRIELEDFNGIQGWAEYSVFRIDSEKYNYNLLIGEYRGSVGDAMKYHNDNDFSTYDKRNDKTKDACCSCAMGYASGWWFDNCSEANLNGIYHYSPLGHNYVGIMWELWHGDYSLKKTRMMIRPRNANINGTTIYSQDYHEDP